MKSKLIELLGNVVSILILTVLAFGLLTKHQYLYDLEW